MAYVALPIVVMPLLLGILYWRARARTSIAASAVRWAVGAGALAFVVGGLTVVHEVVTSESSTAVLAIVLIGPIGLTLAIFAFGVTWGLAVIGQWVLTPSRPRPLDGWAVPLGCLILPAAAATAASAADRPSGASGGRRASVRARP